MNKKGFTLIELLATVVILTIVLIVLFPSVASVLNSSKRKINEMNLKSLEEGARIFGEEVLNCQRVTDPIITTLTSTDFPSNIRNKVYKTCHSSSWVNSSGNTLANDSYTTTTSHSKASIKVNCCDVRERLKNSGIEVTIDFLKSKGYFTDTSSKCKLKSGEKIKIQLVTNNKIDIILTGVECKS